MIYAESTCESNPSGSTSALEEQERIADRQVIHDNEEAKAQKMERKQLQELQALPLKEKIEISKNLISEWYRHHEGQIYLSFSGGKDSTVLLHLVRSLHPDVPAVFCDTGLEYPEIRKFALEHENVAVIRPQMRFAEVVEKYGYPVVSKEQAQFIEDVRRGTSAKLVDIRMNGTKLEDGRIGRLGKISERWKFLIDAPFKISSHCCIVMKKRPLMRYEKESARATMTGAMASESRRRTTTCLMHGCNAFEAKRPKSTPLAFWTDQDVLQYLVEFRVPYCTVYGDIVNEGEQLKTSGCQRTGCFACAFGVQYEKGENRFMRLERTHPQLWSYCIHTLGFGAVLDYIGVSYANPAISG